MVVMIDLVCQNESLETSCSVEGLSAAVRAPKGASHPTTAH
jgi:hypothetical protein